jgi:hypothetical protein
VHAQRAARQDGTIPENLARIEVSNFGSRLSITKSAQAPPSTAEHQAQCVDGICSNIDT